MSGEKDLVAGEETFEFPRLSRSFFELSPQPMIAVQGATHVVRYVNASFLHLVGKEGQEMIGRPFAEAVPEGAANGCQSLLDRVYRTGKPEIIVEQSHGPTPPICWSYSVWAILGADEIPAGLIIQVTDSTDISVFRGQATAINESLLVSSLRQHELTETAERLNALLQAAIRAKDHFLAVLSHELRNPLAPLRNGLELLKLLEDQPNEARDIRAMMERQLNQMVVLVNDLLDISRITTGKLQLRRDRVELKTVIDAAVETSRSAIEEAGHEFSVAVPDEATWVDGDVTRLAQVVSNLLNNSAKYTHRGGQIRLAVRRENGMAVVAVADNGIGIPPNMLDKVFEMFTQVDRALERTTGGLGIGLSLVKGLVEMHGGSIEVNSEGKGRGSEFTVRLPIVLSAVEKVRPPVVDEPVKSTSRRRILVADDNLDSAESLGRLLKLLGNDVSTAHDGLQAVDVAEAFRPDIILLDIGMPKLNGYEACCRIREQPWGKNIILVAMTGWGQDEDKRRSQAAGFNHHLVKPVDFVVLEKLLSSLKAETA